MKKIVSGIVAPVDAGKTTLAENLLYLGQTIRKIGRVDRGDAFLDPQSLEKKRGITISAHQAELKLNNLSLTLLDTPGHIDFAAATEQVLNVLDYSILLVPATDGVTGAIQFLWELLKRAQVPTFIFVNKMDAPGANQTEVLKQLQQLDPNCIDFTGASLKMTPEVADNVAACDEQALEKYLESGQLADETTRQLIAHRHVFPVCFGSALHQQGVSELLTAMDTWTKQPCWSKKFSAQCFKISHSNHDRLSWLRVTGGVLHVKDELLPGEKADQLRIYNGAKFQTVTEVPAGDVCAVTGLTSTNPGMTLGYHENTLPPLVQPVMTYTVDLGQNNSETVYPALQELADEDPSLHVQWNRDKTQIQVQAVGQVQLEILQQRLADEYGLSVKFGQGQIMYTETITQPIEGVGHFEPLRHYAEVHLLLEPLPQGSGLQFASHCREEVLPANWQHQIMVALGAKQHHGVLVGAPLTDMRITLVGGRGSIVHSVGGDFRKATWRAVRQGLMEIRDTGCQLLEPWYRFRIHVTNQHVGRVINDIAQMGGQSDAPQMTGDHSIISGLAPVSQMYDYAMTLRSFTHGEGQIELTIAGQRPCQNAEQVINEDNYVPTSDLSNTPDSVFCAHGAGYPVKWSDVPSHMHVDYCTKYHD